MISPEEIKTKAEKKYIPYLQSLIEEKPFSKIEIPGDKSYKNLSHEAFQKAITNLQNDSKQKKGVGYTINYQKVKTKKFGEQDVPNAIYFDTAKDFLKYLKKGREVNDFNQDRAKTIKKFPELKEWIFKQPLKIIENHTKWNDILKVCEYFKQNPKPNLYIRELPISVHTKFIEENKKIINELLTVLIPEHIDKQKEKFEQRFHLKFAENCVRFKILDKAIVRKFFSGLDDISIPISQFERLNLPIKTVLIVENKTTLYTTLTLPKKENTMAIFGSGMAVSILQHVQWFHNIELFYWGDIDAQGFEILSSFRSHFPHTKSFLMDKKTFDNFFDNVAGTITNNTKKLNLTDEEQQFYDHLKANNYRLEQEKIPIDYVKNSYEFTIGNV